jgi:hypothetical protein
VPPVRQHDFGAEQVVRGEAAGPAERAVAAAQAQAGHADRAAVAHGREQVVSAGGGGYVLGRAPPATVATSAFGSTATSRIPVRSMTSPPSRRARPAQSWPPARTDSARPWRPRGAHGRLHVLGLPAERDYRRVAAHGAVPDAAARLVEFVTRQSHIGYGCPQLVRTA